MVERRPTVLEIVRIDRPRQWESYSTAKGLDVSMTGTVEEDPDGGGGPGSDGMDPRAPGPGQLPGGRPFRRGRRCRVPGQPARGDRGEGIAATSGFIETFVGVAMLAVATSFPELVASLSAVRLVAFDLAVGNLFGSNAIKHGDARDRRSRLHPRASAIHGCEPQGDQAGVGGDLAHGLAAVVHGKETRIKRLEPDALLLLLAYGGSVAVASAST
jgi:hypothetical protein